MEENGETGAQEGNNIFIENLQCIRHRDVLTHLLLFFFKFIYLFLAVLGLCCCAQAFSS